MKATYQITRKTTTDSRELAEFLTKEGQLLLPMVELIEQAQCAVDDLVDVMGRATIEAILKMSAEQIAGPRQQGKADPSRDTHWYGTQKGRVALSDRQLRGDVRILSHLVQQILQAVERHRKAAFHGFD